MFSPAPFEEPLRVESEGRYRAFQSSEFVLHGISRMIATASGFADKLYIPRQAGKDIVISI